MISNGFKWNQMVSKDFKYIQMDSKIAKIGKNGQMWLTDRRRWKWQTYISTRSKDTRA